MEQQQGLYQEEKNYKNLSSSELAKIVFYHRPEYKNILNPQQLKIVEEFSYRMIQAGQTLRDTLWWLDQFMYQKSQFFGLKKEDPLFVLYNLNAEEMVALVRMAYSITQDKRYGAYFRDRADGYKGGLIKYFIDSTIGAFDYRTREIVEGKVIKDKFLNSEIDPKYTPILIAWDEASKLSKEKKDLLFEKIVGEKLK
ncbi:MAG: hypothetical protein QXV64_01360 [Candidatus Anstonellaceae archaeon]